MCLPECCVNGQPGVHYSDVERTKGTFFKQHNSIYQNHEYLESACLVSFKHFLKFICFAQRIFNSKSECLMIHRHHLRYNSVLINTPERLISENYKVIDVFDNPFCSVLPLPDFVQRPELRSVGYDPC